MNNVSVRVMTPEEILEKITEEKDLKLSAKLAKSLSGNGVVVSLFEDNFGEVQVCNVCVDFSEHDKKVTEEKDAEIRELKRQIEDLEAIIADGKKPDISISENGLPIGCECGGYHLAKERIEELEKENNSLKEKLSFIRTRVTEEARDFWDKDMFGSLVVTIPKKFSDDERVIELEKENIFMKERFSLLRTRCKPGIEKDFDKGLFGKLAIVGCNEEFADNQNKRISELEDRRQSDCIEINRLHTALEVMTEKYMKLREVHGL